jgi:hypothetical protein
LSSIFDTFIGEALRLGRETRTATYAFGTAKVNDRPWPLRAGIREAAGRWATMRIGNA